MKKYTSVILALAVLFGALGITVFAKEQTLSPGIACLAMENALIKSGKPGEDVRFYDSDFRQFFGVTSYPHVTVLTLPKSEEGVLKLDSLRVVPGQTIPRSRIEQLTFTPANHLVKEASFTFSAGELAGGSAFSCKITIEEDGNRAPTHQTLPRFAVYAGKTVRGTLAGYDPDGDQLEYLIISYPQNGILTVSDPSLGDFLYSPVGNFKGKDTFTYVIRDGRGNYSAPATVDIWVEKQGIDLSFGDMKGSSYEDAAIRTVERGVMEATQIGDTLYFMPDAVLTRGEWIASLIKALGIPTDVGDHSYFDDDAYTDAALIPYLCEAGERGIYTGTWEGGKLLAKANQPITRKEAADILYRAIQTTPGLHLASADTAPIKLLCEMGLFPTRGGHYAENGAFTKEQGADILNRLITWNL